ncbi:MAG: CARDB domain-containing protein [Dehalococcoidia bacterium]
MKKIFGASVLVLVILQICLFPSSVQSTIACPTVSTLPATSIGNTSATLNGSVSIPYLSLLPTQKGIIPTSSQYAFIDGYQVYVSFQYGVISGVYIHETPAVLMTGPGNFQAIINDLSPCTTHYARAKVHTVISSIRFDHYKNILQGAGVGIYPYHLQQSVSIPFGCPDSYGNEISFTTAGCFINTGPGSHGTGGMTGFGTPSPPANPPNVLVSSAAVASTKVSPGEKVDISAAVTNKGGSSGTSKVTLFINGQEAESKGITLSSGESTTLHFSVSRNDPGTYTVNVNNVPAGSFTVDQFKNNGSLIYGVIALFIIGIAAIVFLLVRKRTA